ncbi:glutathione synthase [Ignatzschineria sp. F8392]|uniref:glutathione synthase n=1 Tax=Ignatzschineria sp. F8392 TaxID=1980117 RepID=UPI000B98C779|nr:glutathione synthase [Ignatzschineria sp. F8392]OYQ79503.1 glutathione synthase [Ignatzschineria sp. F8392]
MTREARIIFIMDPIESLPAQKDTTIGMMMGAVSLGLPIYYSRQESIYLLDGAVQTTAQKINLKLKNERELASFEDWYQLDEAENIIFGENDIVLQRKDPPFNMHYIHATYLLELMERQGAFVCNRPDSLRDCNEKMFTAWFPELTPPTLVSSQSDKIKAFIAQHHDTIVKPLDGMGGSSIFRVTENDPNLNVILETMTEHNQTSIMVQRYIPEIKKGDKRIILINGVPAPYLLARVPAANETRGNLAAGATGVVQTLSENDRLICEKLGPELVKRGLYFVGLDVIGDYLTEINVTSPTGIRQIDTETGSFLGRDLIEALLNLWQERKSRA